MCIIFSAVSSVKEKRGTLLALTESRNCEYATSAGLASGAPSGPLG